MVPIKEFASFPENLWGFSPTFGYWLKMARKIGNAPISRPLQGRANLSQLFAEMVQPVGVKPTYPFGIRFRKPVPKFIRATAALKWRGITVLPSFHLVQSQR